jgi:hypothetical protein
VGIVGLGVFFWIRILGGLEPQSVERNARNQRPRGRLFPNRERDKGKAPCIFLWLVKEVERAVKAAGHLVKNVKLLRSACRQNRQML